MPICPFCKNTFLGRPNKIFCSDLCRNRFHNLEAQLALKVQFPRPAPIPKESNRLNDYTSAELLAAQNHLQRKERACRNCGELKEMRPNQFFCCSKCQVEFNNNKWRKKAEELIEQLQARELESAQEIGRLEAENLRLRSEIARLREG